MQLNIRTLIAIGIFLALLLGIQVMGRVSVPADRGAWAVGRVYVLNDTVSYDGSTYRCTQTHVSQDKWTPPVTMSMWQSLAAGPTSP